MTSPRVPEGMLSPSLGQGPYARSGVRPAAIQVRLLRCEECQRTEQNNFNRNALSGVVTQVESLDLDLTILEFWYVLFDELEGVLINVLGGLLVEDPGFSGRHGCIL